MDKWTRTDEAMLTELLRRKSEVEAKLMGPLNALLVKQFEWAFPGEFDLKHLGQILAENADAFRDALKPFDSGVRCDSGEASNG